MHGGGRKESVAKILGFQKGVTSVDSTTVRDPDVIRLLALSSIWAVEQGRFL